MTRATETHSIIQKCLPELPMHKIQACSMIREGRAFETIPRFESSGWIHPKFEDPDPIYVADGSRVFCSIITKLSYHSISDDKMHSL
jgi:hypothetical protein